MNNNEDGFRDSFLKLMKNHNVITSPEKIEQKQLTIEEAMLKIEVLEAKNESLRSQLETARQTFRDLQSNAQWASDAIHGHQMGQ